MDTQTINPSKISQSVNKLQSRINFTGVKDYNFLNFSPTKKQSVPCENIKSSLQILDRNHHERASMPQQTNYKVFAASGHIVQGCQYR